MLPEKAIYIFYVQDICTRLYTSSMYKIYVQVYKHLLLLPLLPWVHSTRLWTHCGPGGYEKLQQQCPMSLCSQLLEVVQPVYRFLGGWVSGRLARNISIATKISIATTGGWHTTASLPTTATRHTIIAARYILDVTSLLTLIC